MARSSGVLFPLLCVVSFGLGQTRTAGDRPTVYEPGQNNGVCSYTAEGFEDERFPPAGWTLQYSRPLYWGRYLGASAFGIGSGSARFEFFMAPAGTIQSLVLAALGPTAAGDSLVFDHAYATYTSEVDQLVVETSADGGVAYSPLASLNGGTSGPLVTAPPTKDQFVPTASQWGTKRFPLPVGTNRVRFRAMAQYGNCLYLDNITIGTRPQVDVGVQSIDVASPTVAMPQAPKFTVKNHGTAVQSFIVGLEISPGGYSSERTVGNLPVGLASQVSFDEWTPAPGLYTATAYTDLAGDADRSNDTATASIGVNEPRQVGNLNAVFRDGQVFVTWDNLSATNVIYTLYRSPGPIRTGQDLMGSENLGDVRDNSSFNRRLSNITGTQTYLKIDSASTALVSIRGLFVATTTTPGSNYYAVTATTGGIEDTTILPGANALTTPVDEIVMMPRPVWQETRVIGGKTFEVYVQFTTRVISSIYPQMTNAGSFPHHFAIVKSGDASPHPVTFWMHGGGLTFLSVTSMRTTGDPNEWVVAIDDWNPAIDEHTVYYGFHENYDLHADVNPIPDSGTLHNYTAARVAHTVDWALRNLPLDSTRTYMTGWSMGGIGSLFNSMMLRDRIAAIFIYAPKVDLTQWQAERMWGRYDVNLQTNEGLSRNERLNALALLSRYRDDSLPLMFTFCGRRDDVVGWPEKIALYDTMAACRLGGAHFWSNSDHWQVFDSSPWQPTFPNFSFMTRYRTDLSYPAFGSCSADDDPGDGIGASGVLIGAINGHLDWADDIVDAPDRWEITIFMKDLRSTGGVDPAPDTATVDVTPRRLQAFSVPKGAWVFWENRRGDAVVQRDSFLYDGGPVTIPGFIAYKDTSRLSVGWIIVGVAERNELPWESRLEQNYPNPFNPSTTITYELPISSMVNLSVYDMLGREVSVLVNERRDAGVHEVKFDGSGLSSGVYVYRLRAGDFVQTRKLVLLQ